MSEIVNGNQLDKNESRKTNVKKTKFPIIEELHGTYRFGEYGVGLVYNGIANDKVRIRQSSEVDSYSLQAPLKTPISMNKTYFQVTRMCLLPNAWEKIFTNPSIGQDIDATQYGTSVDKTTWTAFMNQLVTNINQDVTQYLTDESSVSATVADLRNDLMNIIDSLMNAELIYSNGSLINAMGANMHKLWSNIYHSFDEDFDTFIRLFKRAFGAIKVTNTRTSITYIVRCSYADNIANAIYQVIEFRRLLEELRDGETFTLDAVYDDTTLTEITSMPNMTAALNALTIALGVNGPLLKATGCVYNQPFDIAFPEAYQISCAEFFTNDKVDYIYNGELYRQYVGNLVRYILSTNWGSNMFYTINGIQYEADYLSAKAFGLATGSLNRTLSALYTYRKAYIFAIFKYNRSLKYKDYFVGARTRPIAIDTLGKTDVQVESNNTVQVINIAKGIQWQRFLYVVNKIPRDLKGYTKGIMGKDIAPDWHNPLFLGRVSEVIYGQETENTGADQLTQGQTRTTTLKNQGKNYMFEFTLDRNSIIIGIVDFDIPRSYSKGVNRMFMDVDRFDMFNPYLQYTGDQPVYGEELNAKQTQQFGYQGPYMHMKQGYNRAFGGFIESLKGWTFLDEYVEKDDTGLTPTRVIGPDFIRSRPSELDRFYISLTENALGNYYHFIIDHTNYIEAVRPMSYNPQILG